ncbi:MAG: hypothetical protein ACKOS8_07190 [Gemmataceae bacterium]
MTRLLDRPPAGPARSPNTPSVPDEGPWIDSTPAAEHLRQHCAAVRLQLRWWGTSRTLSARQKSDLIGDAGVDSRFLRASKQIIDRAHPTRRLLPGIRGRITGTWRRLGLPFVEPGVRLIPRPLIPEFEQAMELYRQELAAGVEELAEAFPGLLEAARERLGEQLPDAIAQALGLMNDPRIELLLEVDRAAPARIVRLANLPAQTR